VELGVVGIVLYVLDESVSVDGVISGVGVVFGLGLYSCAGWTACEVPADPVFD
jgi:hypothetical protein